MPVVTISRLYGTGGNQIGRRVAEILGYSYFDKKVIAEVATEMKLSVDQIVDLSEDTYRMRNFVEQLFGLGKQRVRVARKKAYPNGGRVEVETLNRDESLSLIQNAILTAYEREDVVIVGRGGQALLKEKPGVLHVRIEAPLRARVMTLKEREGLATYAEAENRLLERDQTAAAYLERFYEIDWSNLSYYHLVINAANWDMEGAAQTIAGALQHLPRPNLL